MVDAIENISWKIHYFENDKISTKHVFCFVLNHFIKRFIRAI